MPAHNKKGLGRSFQSLIPTDLLDESFDPTVDQDEKVSDLRSIKISEVHPDPDQPRRFFEEDALAELANSIRAHGIIQPLIVTPDHKLGYIIVAGERRYRAAVLADLEKIPVIVRTMDDQRKLELSIIENVQRRDLTAIEVATAYQKLRDQFNLSIAEIGEKVGGKSVSAVSNTLRLLKLPYSAKEALANGQITEGQARPLIGLDNEFVDQLIPRIIAEHWSARQVESAVTAARSQGKKAVVLDKKSAQPVDKKILTKLEKTVGTKVKIVTTPTGAGTISLRFSSLEERARLIDLLDK